MIKNNDFPSIYGKFVSELELKEVVLSDLKVKLRRDIQKKTSHFRVELTESYGYSQKSKKEIEFQATLTLVAKNPSNEEEALRIEVEFSLDFGCQSKITEEIFDYYKKTSLRLNITPYFREITQNITSRMGIPPLTLPLFKIL